MGKPLSNFLQLHSLAASSDALYIYNMTAGYFGNLLKVVVVVVVVGYELRLARVIAIELCCHRCRWKQSKESQTINENPKKRGGIRLKLELKPVPVVSFSSVNRRYIWLPRLPLHSPWFLDREYIPLCLFADKVKGNSPTTTWMRAISLICARAHCERHIHPHSRVPLHSWPRSVASLTLSMIVAQIYILHLNYFCQSWSGRRLAMGLGLGLGHGWVPGVFVAFAAPRGRHGMWQAKCRLTVNSRRLQHL